ncbi:GPI-anchor transamidase GPI17 [Sporobolomyces salmoneus]|uniref:GPI-anchor transamidase GPI17 n=1 Tax=Sporobolomyces salmoneus TaxID=183962 RepID=UPI00317A24F7
MSNTTPLKPTTPEINLKTRRITLFSFWTVFVLLGVPLWWKTTSLERRQLPEQRIQQWDQYIHENDDTRISRQVEGGRVVKYSPHYKLVFSLLNQNSSPSSDPLLSWDIDQLLQQHFKPLLSSLSPLHNFTIESQVQYYSPLSINLLQDEASDSSTTWVQENDVKAFVNNAEWNLASGTTLDPVLHFILYVPSAENRPMKIKTSQTTATTSFITPQRGGLVIYNPSSATSLDSSFRTFSRQLRLLLGLPRTTSNVDQKREIEDLVTNRLGEALKDTTSTLVNLVKTISEEDGTQAANVSVGLTVQSRVERALDLLDSAHDCSQSASCTLSDQLARVSLAQELANKAYFDPSLLPMLYFPQEHKYAVYTPLFGPVSVPLVVGLIRELKEWKKRRKEKVEAKEREKSE